MTDGELFAEMHGYHVERRQAAREAAHRYLVTGFVCLALAVLAAVMGFVVCDDKATRLVFSGVCGVALAVAVSEFQESRQRRRIERRHTARIKELCRRRVNTGL